ncbi:MAG: ABC transporter permease [Armatimonadota bacterium]|nr:ABC transporter permease [Armatimonadota bacterium]MDR5698063.1 ABC transporter permease [Armatimonadota bacterium]
MSTDQLVLLLAAAVGAGTPLVLAGLGEVFAERSGVLNLGIDGVMLIGAMAGFAVVLTTGDPWLGVGASLLAGGLLGAGHALLTVTLGTEQVTTGLALAMFGTGLSAFLGKPLIGIPNPAPFAAVPLPGLSGLPVLGRVLFQQNALVYASYALALIGWLWLMRTRQGLHLRACGEDPAAADAVGVNVTMVRYAATVGGAALAGLAGGYLSLAYTPAWTENMTGGLGWIAIGLVVFSTWHPLRLLAGAYLFGAVEVAGFWAQLAGIEMSSILLRMAPYLFTLVVLVLITWARGAAGMPAALGRPYFRER